MSQYEGIFILSPALDEGGIKQNISKIEEIIKKQGGKVSNKTDWGKRHLPYSVKKKREGYFVIIDFILPPEKVGTIQVAYRLNEDLLRTIITAKESSVKQ